MNNYPWPSDVLVDSVAGEGSVGCRDFIRERHTQASFNGIPFAVDTDGWQGGRRNVTHQFPSSERWVNEDLGQKAVGVSVRGYVYGDRVEEWAHMLFEACTSFGFSTLYLPMRPKMQARCNDILLEWNSEKQGRMDVTMEFVLENKPTISDFPWSTSLAAAQVSTSSQVMVDKSRDAMSRIALSQRPSSAYAAAADEIKKIGRQLRRAIDEAPLPSTVSSAVALVGLTMQRESVSFAYGLRQRPALISPTSFGGGQEKAVIYSAKHDYIQAVDSVIKQMHAGSNDVGSQETMARALQRWSSLRPMTSETSIAASSRQVQELVDMVVKYARWQAVATQVVLLTKVPDSLEKSPEVGARVYSHLSSEIEEADAFPDLQESIRLVASSWSRYLDVVKRSQVRRVVIKSAGPLAIVASDLYGGTEVKDVEHDRKLMQRNSIRHPLFVYSDVDAAVEPMR